jgi:hypothetical protein
MWTRPRALLRFAATFLLAYAAGIAAWPLLERAYAALFRTSGETLLAPFVPRGTVVFRPRAADEPGGADTEVVVKKRGNPKEVQVNFGSRKTGYLPAVFLIALIVASPVPRRRRVVALLWGLLAVHVLVAARVGGLLFATWRDPAAGGTVITTIQNALARRVWASGEIGVVLIWILTTFRIADWQSLLPAAARPGRAAREERRSRLAKAK